MELKWQMRSGDSSSRLSAGPRAHCKTMHAPLPPFYLHSRLLLQHPFRRSLLAARRQGVHSGWCMPSLKDTQGSHSSCPKEQSSWRSLPSHPFLCSSLGWPCRATTACLAGATPPALLQMLQVLNWDQPGNGFEVLQGSHAAGVLFPATSHLWPGTGSRRPSHIS